MVNNSQVEKIFAHNAKIANVHSSDDEAIWPHNIELCISRFPIKKRDGYTPEFTKEFCDQLYSHMALNGIVFLVCYAPTESKSRPFKIASAMEDAGFTHIDNIIIQKTWYPGKRSEVNLVNSHEYVLYFCKGKVWNLDRAPISKYLGTSEDMSCPGNTWQVKTGSLDEAISNDLSLLLLRMTDALPGSVVFDPFMGNQNVLVNSIKLGHSFYGFEPEPKKFKKYKTLLSQKVEKIKGIQEC